MIFLHPIWLFALATISIPVAIHLWNVRPGKTLKVGSISLINASSQNSRSFRLHDLLLLLLRCLLLALVALVLALPFLQRQFSSSKIKGWVLVPRENLKESYQKFKPEIDSLTTKGYEFHYFAKGFAKADLHKILTDTAVPRHNDPVSYWNLISQLNGQVPSSIPVYLFTPNRSAYFTGERPEVAFNLHWKTYISADSINKWIEKAWFTNADEIRVAEGNSRPSGTFYSYYTIRQGDEQTPFTIRTENGNLSVSLKNSDQAIIADTTTWRFAIYADKGSADAHYVKAALSSIVQFSKHKAVIKQYDDPAQIPVHQSWVFWLSAKPLSKDLIPANLFAYEPGKPVDKNTWIDDGIISLSSQKINLYKIITAPGNGYAIWKDGFGSPVLGLEKQGQTNHYHFYSRFDPAWSDLVWNADFPKMLLRLIAGPPAGNYKSYDRRVIDAQQIMPVVDSGMHTTSTGLNRKTDISYYSWLLLVLIFAAERWLAHQKNKKTISNG